MLNYIVHDGRLPSGLGAIVYHRLLRRSGADSEVMQLLSTQGAAYFWRVTVQDLLERRTAADERLILFGITYLDIDPNYCNSRIAELKRRYAELEIWSHRWPDGFAQRWDVRIPPDDIVFGQLSRLLTPLDKQYLRFSLMAARIVPVNGSQAEEADFVELLADIVADSPEAWDRLVKFETPAELDDLAAGAPAVKRASNGLEIYSNDKQSNILELSVPPDLATREIVYIDVVLKDQELPVETLVVAWLSTNRLLLYRHDPSLSRPSIRWLIEKRFSELVPEAIRGQHYGQQDAVYFEVDPSFKRDHASDIQSLAKSLVRQSTGGRYLPAGLSRSVATLANKVLQETDFRRLYTGGDNPDLSVRASELYTLIHVSSRLARLRKTLTVQIRAESPEAISFLYRDGGYNLLKIERMLEGAVLGMSLRELPWLTVGDVPTRLRVDVHPILEEADIPKIQEVLRRPRMSSFGRESRFVSDESLIGRFLTHLDMNRLVAYAESETIGPSVAHALTLLAVANTFVTKSRRPRAHGGAEVLDLFSGSGVANRLLSRSSHTVVSVDMYVDVASLGLDKERDGIWLKADARDVVSREGAILDRSYDVIGLDPPHSELVEIMFGASDQVCSLTELCSDRSGILVMYQGHSTQSGRLSIVKEGLRRSKWPEIAAIQVEEELIVVAASVRSEFSTEDFSEFVEATVRKIVDQAADMRLGDLFVRRVL
jgi:16S rRNA G966 N2-methylase RsmD